MNRHRASVGICMLCALALSAVAAQSASAATKGTTAFTCVKGAGTLKGGHCLTTGGAAAEYGHVAVAQNTTTEVTATNQNTSSETTAPTTVRLKETIGGVSLELQATGWSGSGWIENKIDANGEHYIEDGGTVTFSGVTVAVPAGKGCKVFRDEGGKKGEEGVVATNELKVTSTEQGDFLKFEPAATTFATFFLEGCTPAIPACEGTWEFTGSLKAAPNGATVSFNHAEITTQNTFKGKGNKAGLEGIVTIRGKDAVAGDKEFTPLSVTTVETP